MDPQAIAGTGGTDPWMGPERRKFFRFTGIEPTEFNVLIRLDKQAEKIGSKPAANAKGKGKPSTLYQIPDSYTLNLGKPAASVVTADLDVEIDVLSGAA